MLLAGADLALADGHFQILIIKSPLDREDEASLEKRSFPFSLPQCTGAESPESGIYFLWV